jgi:hypothetical protein
MPNISNSEGSPLRKWTLVLPTQFSGTQPEWLVTSFGLGYIGVAHTAQPKFGLHGVAVSCGLYATCAVLGLVTGKLVRRLTDRLTRNGADTARIPRIVAVVIVLAGFCVSGMPGPTGVPTARQWADQWPFLGTATLLVLLAVIGEALACWFPAAEPEPAIPVVPVPVAAPPARRRRHWRLRIVAV